MEVSRRHGCRVVNQQQCEGKGEVRCSLIRGKTCRCVAITRNYGEPHNGVAGKSRGGQTNRRSEQQYGSEPRKSIETGYERRSLRRTEKVRGELRCVLVGLEKTDNGVPGQECGTGLGSFAGEGECSKLIRNQL